MATTTRRKAERGRPIQVWVVIERDRGGWHAYAPQVPGSRAAGDTIAEARRNIRRQVARTFAQKAGAATRLELVTEIRFLAVTPKSAVARAHKARAAALRAETEAAQRESEVARYFHRRGMVPADIAEVLRIPLSRAREMIGWPG